MAQIGMVTMDIMVPEATMIPAIAAPIIKCTALTAGTTNVACMVMGITEADTAGGDGVYATLL
jgi:hypothetical protein